MGSLKLFPLVLLSFLLFLSQIEETKGAEVCDCGPSEFVSKLTKIEKVDSPTHQFVDSFGRTRWFHGTNVVSKSFPYHPALGGPDVCDHSDSLNSPFCDSDIDYLQELGVNAVRLGVMWPGAEPTRGTYNCTYICVIHGIIQKLASKGIYTLVDVHQDVLAKQMCGEGVPDWYMKKDWLPSEEQFPWPLQKPFETDENGIPDPYDQCYTLSDWFLNYFTKASADAFGRLYSNYDGLMDSFTDYWAKLASEYGNYSCVLGYDLLNEPWAGDIYKDPTLLIPGFSDRKNLEYLWENCSEKIRKVDPSTIIFFEGVTWDITDGHLDVPGKDGSKAAMGYHYYSPPQLDLESSFKNRIRDQVRLKTGGILTEFRMWAAEGEEDSEVIDKRIRNTIEAADEYLQSWMGWGYRSILTQDKSIAKHYARTYAPAVAGIVQKMGFNEDTSYFYLIFETNNNISAPTEIKINQRIYYPGGFRLSVHPEGAATWELVGDDKNQNIELHYTDKAVNGEIITIEIIQDDVGTSTEEEENSTSGSTELGLSAILLPICLHLFFVLTDKYLDLEYLWKLLF